MNIPPGRFCSCEGDEHDFDCSALKDLLASTKGYKKSVSPSDVPALIAVPAALAEQIRVISFPMNVLDEVREQRKEQDRLWGRPERTDSEWVSALTEEIGEVATAANRVGKDAPANPNFEFLRAELIQVAAVAVAWIEDIDSRNTEND
jgi:hypothetical protein